MNKDNTDKIKECVKSNIYMNEEEQERYEIKKRIKKHMEDYRHHLQMIDIHGDMQLEMVQKELQRYIKTLEKEEKLKEHIKSYVNMLQASGTPIDEDMIINETKRFQQVLENEEK